MYFYFHNTSKMRIIGVLYIPQDTYLLLKKINTMKRELIFIVFTFILLSLSSCSNNDGTNDNSEQTKDLSEIKVDHNFDWLLGKWQRINEEKGIETFEVWNKESNSEYKGIGFSMKENDTISQEKMTILKSDKIWALKVIAKGEIETTNFKITNIEDFKFTCENKELDFPNKIEYWKDGDKIKALVSGTDLEIAFEFVKY